MNIQRFLFRRLLLVVPLLLFILFFTFMIIRIGGQDPIGLLAGPLATTEELQLIETELGLDKPFLMQFWLYISNVVQGDFGNSWLSNRSVSAEFLERLPITIELLFWGTGIGTLIGIPVGLRAAWKHDKAFDQIARFVSLLGFSTPTYFLGLLMILVFFYYLGWAPPAMGRLSMMVDTPPAVTNSYLIDGLLVADWEAARSAFSHLVMPVIAIAIISAAPIIKQTRAIAMDVLSSEFVRNAEAQGLAQKVRRRMVLRNSITPVITFIGAELTALVGVTSVIEFIFAWGGIGQYGLQAIVSGDFAVVQAYVLLLALFSLIVFTIVDLMVVFLEPRSELQP